MSAILKGLLGFGSSLMGGLWGYLITAGAGAVAATLLTWHLVHISNASEIDGLKLQIAQQQTVNVTAALNQLQGFISNLHNAETGYAGDLKGIDNRFAALQRELQNAFAKPLPIDCKPTPDRVRAFHSAIDGANTQQAPAATP
jgi:hypothetical protein